MKVYKQKVYITLTSVPFKACYHRLNTYKVVEYVLVEWNNDPENKTIAKGDGKSFLQLSPAPYLSCPES